MRFEVLKILRVWTVLLVRGGPKTSLIPVLSRSMGLLILLDFLPFFSFLSLMNQRETADVSLRWECFVFRCVLTLHVSRLHRGFEWNDLNWVYYTRALPSELSFFLLLLHTNGWEFAVVDLRNNYSSSKKKNNTYKTLEISWDRITRDEERFIFSPRCQKRIHKLMFFFFFFCQRTTTSILSSEIVCWFIEDFSLLRCHVFFHSIEKWSMCTAQRDSSNVDWTHVCFFQENW